MEILVYTGGSFLAAVFLLAMHEIAKEIRGIRTVLEVQYKLEPIPVRTNENRYKRKGVEL